MGAAIERDFGFATTTYNLTVRNDIDIFCVKGKQHQKTTFMYLRATPHIYIVMYKEEEEQEKSPIFTMENEGVARKQFFLSQGPLI